MATIDVRQAIKLTNEDAAVGQLAVGPTLVEAAVELRNELLTAETTKLRNR